MRTIGIFNYEEKVYSSLAQILSQEDITLIPLKNGQLGENISLYIFDIDNEQELENIKFDLPFIIVSGVGGAKPIIKSGKIGALDYISKPFIDVEVTAKRMERLISVPQTNAECCIIPAQNTKCDKLIDIELKRASRGKYPITLASVTFESRLNKEVLIRLIDKMKTVLRESDSCIPYSEQVILSLLPFADKAGSDVVAKKLTDVLQTLGYKAKCTCLTYPEDGESREELLEGLSSVKKLV